MKFLKYEPSPNLPPPPTFPPPRYMHQEVDYPGKVEVSCSSNISEEEKKIEEAIPLHIKKMVGHFIVPPPFPLHSSENPVPRAP